MHSMIFISFILILSTSSHAEEFLKCSAVGKANEKCFKDFYPDQEAQETNVFNAFENEYPNEAVAQVYHPEQPPPGINHPVQYSEQNQFIQGQEYDYGYSVNDETTGDQKTHRETRHDNVVHGTYSLIEPDGTRRTVVYTADDINGFNAVVYKDEANTNGFENNFNSNDNNFNRNYDNDYNPDFYERPDSLRVVQSSKPHSYAPTDVTPSETNRNFPEYRISNISPASLDTKLHPAIHDHIYNPQIPINNPRPFGLEQTHFNSDVQNSGFELINQLDGIFGEETLIKSLITGVHHNAAVSSPQDSPSPIQVAPSEKTGEQYIPTISSSTANPIKLDLVPRLVENGNSELLQGTRHEFSETEQLNPNGSSVSANSTEGPQTANILTQIVTNTPSPILVPDDHSTTFAVVENPKHIESTPVPITADRSIQRLNTLTYGEFPLLAHVSPSYARRYARHYA